MAKQFFLDNRPHNGLSYIQYLDLLKNKIETADLSVLDSEQLDKHEKRKLNYQRSTRISKTYTINEELSRIIKAINISQLWMILSEDWCGDSAQIIPYLSKMADSNPNIKLRILLRDENTDIMDLYLTNGNRAIPKLVAFDSIGNELFIWGPRPVEGQDVIDRAKIEGKSKEQFLQELHLWYGRNRGKSIEEEMRNILQQFIS